MEKLNLSSLKDRRIQFDLIKMLKIINNIFYQCRLSMTTFSLKRIPTNSVTAPPKSEPSKIYRKNMAKIIFHKEVKLLEQTRQNVLKN